MKLTSAKWLAGLGLAIVLCVNAQAQGKGHHGDHHRSKEKEKSHDRHSAKGDLAKKIYHITDADSVQKTKMKPVLDKTAKRLEALRLTYQKQEKQALDSLSVKLKPYLREEQAKRLSDWRDKAKSR